MVNHLFRHTLIRKGGEGMENDPVKQAKAFFLAFALLIFLGAGTVPAALPADSYVPLPNEPKLIALTFDDGPKRSTTAALLDGLAQRGARATFFLIGEQIPANEDLVLRMEAEGHQVGIHSWSHVRLTGLNDADFAAEVDRTRTVLGNILGRHDFLLRPPYGLTDEAVLKRADAPILLWSIDPEDWGEKNTAREVEHILAHARDGAILLLHDIYPESIQAALEVVDALHEEGYYFVTVSDLFAARGLLLEKGKIYRSAEP